MRLTLHPPPTPSPSQPNHPSNPSQQNGETAPDPLAEDKDSPNGVQQLGVESTAVHQCFREQVLTLTLTPNTNPNT